MPVHQKENSCCFTGHRPEKLSMSEGKVKSALLQEIMKSINDGYNVFISGMARGVDMWAAEIVLELKDKFADDRRTEIDMTAIDYIEDESLIPVEDSIITLTNKGYIKRLPVDTYKTQNRGGVGIRGMGTNEEDFPEKLVSMKTHDYILFFSNFGKVYRIKGYEIPKFNRQSKGLPIVTGIREVLNSVSAVVRETASRI
mgnify:CR=1 FL=1